MKAQVSVSEAGTHWNLVGGSPAGGDALQSMVSSWPGWRRMPSRGQLLGSQPASLYSAPIWPAQTLFLCRSSLELSWTEGARLRSAQILEQLEARDVVLRAGDADLRRTGSVPWDVAPDPNAPLRQLLPHQAAAVRAIELGGGRALLADDMGCIDGEAIVTINRAGGSRRMSLADAFVRFHTSWRKRPEIETKIRSLCGNEIRLNKVVNILPKGVKPVLRLVLASGKELKLTPDHEVATPEGFVRADALALGRTVLTNGQWIDKDGYVRVPGPANHPRKTTGGVYQHILVAEQMLGEPLGERVVHHKNGVKHDNRPENLEILSKAEHMALHGREGGYRRLDGSVGGRGGKVVFAPVHDTVASIEPAGEALVFDVVCGDPHRNFVANGIVVHNCGKTATALTAWWRSEYRRLLVIAPKSLLFNWRNEAALFLAKPEHIPAFVYAGTDREKANTRAAAEHLVRRGPLLLNQAGGRAILILNFDALRVLPEQWKELVAEWVKHQWLICDECLHGSSLVITDEGEIPIRDVVERGRGTLALSRTKDGELVWRRITRRLKHYGKEGRAGTLRVQGASLHCTGNHRVPYQGGSDRVELLPPETLLYVFEPVPGAPLHRGQTLLIPMQSWIPPQGEPDMEKAECRPSFQGEGFDRRSKETREAIPSTSWRPWEADAEGGACALSSFAVNGRVYGHYRKYGQDGAPRTDALLTGYSIPRAEAEYRGGRKEPLDVFGKEAGCSADEEDEAPWMDRDALLKRAGAHLDGFMRGEGAVYDIEVEETHCYFANRILVGNSHAVKSVTAERTKLVHALAEKAQGVVLISGTPVRNTSEDLFSQLDIVRPGSWTSHSSFVDRYLIRVPMEIPQGPRKRTIMVVRGQKNTPELAAVVNTMQIRRHRSTIEGLPPKIVTRPLIELDDSTRSLYEGMRSKAVAEIGQFLRIDDNAPIFEPRAKSALEAAMRCEQICQGFLGKVPDEYLEVIRPWLGTELVRIPGLDNSLALPSAPKLRWIIELLEELAVVRGERVAVISRFNAPLFYLQSLPELTEKTTMLVGSMSAIQREESVQAFQAGKKQVMLAQIALAEGWSAQNCTDVIFLGRSWSPAANDQAEARFHRIGSKGAVNIQIPLCRGTIEEKIDKRLSNKAQDAEQAVRSMTLKELREAL